MTHQLKGKNSQGQRQRKVSETGDHASAISHSATVTLIDNPDDPACEGQSNTNGMQCNTPPIATRELTENESTSRHPSSSCTLCRNRIVDAIHKVLPRIAVELENTGSTARDHLANERTWLAYIRTSLAIAGTGVGALSSLSFMPVSLATSLGLIANMISIGTIIHNLNKPRKFRVWGKQS